MHGVHEIPGSNPGTPTKTYKVCVPVRRNKVKAEGRGFPDTYIIFKINSGSSIFHHIKDLGKIGTNPASPTLSLKGSNLPTDPSAKALASAEALA